MISYLATKDEFLRDAPQIEDKIRDAVKRKFNHNVSQSEYTSWRNSLGNAMFHVMNDPAIPNDAAVAVEYRLNGRKFRIDFMISGLDERDKESLVISELKQWSDIQLSELADHVKTFVGGALRDERHPSYQAWSYESHLRQFNEYVYSNELSVNSCAYLHNCERDNVIRDLRFAGELNKAPIFIKAELTGLRDLVKAQIKKGAGLSVLERIDASPIRPSKQLADAVGSMLKGNEEFVLLDEQKTVLEKIVNA